MSENNNTDYKSLRFLKGNTTKWDELAKDAVCFANAFGGKIIIGIEDNEVLPPQNQKIADKTIAETIRKKITERTINVGVVAHILEYANGSEAIVVEVLRSAQSLASTTDGRYYIRISTDCTPIPPEEMARVAAEKNAFIWELQTTKKISREKFDNIKKLNFLKAVRADENQRVSTFIKEMGDDELLEYYFLQKDGYLTNLGILWIGKREDRASLLYPPIIQIIRYDENENKVWKAVYDDHFRNPFELLQEVEKLTDWSETSELQDGLFRKNVPLVPWSVIRELVANALVHKTYVSRGDIFINIFQDRVEIHSPGSLPFGVTPENILNKTVPRNIHLAQIFYSLGLMEREGSGYDLVYEQLLRLGKPIPTVVSTDDRVSVTVKKEIIKKEVVNLIEKANNMHRLKQKEVIALGLIAQHGSLSALELSSILTQKDSEAVKNWMGNLLKNNLVIKKGKAKGVQYSLNPDFIRHANFKGKTILKDIEDHRLEELLFKDISAYPASAFGNIHRRIGEEINIHKVRRILKKLENDGKIVKEGINRWARYSIK